MDCNFGMLELGNLSSRTEPQILEIDAAGWMHNFFGFQGEPHFWLDPQSIQVMARRQHCSRRIVKRNLQREGKKRHEAWCSIIDRRVQPVASPNSTRAGTPVPETPLAESIAAEDVLLRQYAAAIADIKSMETNVMRLWRQVISMMLPDIADDELQAEGWLIFEIFYDEAR